MQVLYNTYKKIKAETKGGKPPKNISVERLSWKNQEILQVLDGFFLTKWQNIDPEKYFRCGFELWKEFGPDKFLGPEILELYIRKDKKEKRDTEVSKEGIIESLEYIFKNYSSIDEYANDREGFLLKSVIDYNKGKINQYILVFLINTGLVDLTPEEEQLCSYVVSRYEDLIYYNYKEAEKIIMEWLLYER